MNDLFNDDQQLFDSNLAAQFVYASLFILVFPERVPFLKSTRFLRGKKFKNKEDIKQAMVNFFASKDETFFKYKLPARRQEVINNDDNYII